MAEYAGDFTDAGDMAGFGPLQMTDELRRMSEGQQVTLGAYHRPWK